jgi:PBP1b-binding outer membrane lipoprotein LpoB
VATITPTVCLLALLLVGCARTLPPAVESETTAPDPRMLWQEETDAPSFHRVYQRFLEPSWL